MVNIYGWLGRSFNVVLEFVGIIFPINAIDQSVKYFYVRHMISMLNQSIIDSMIDYSY